MLFFSSLENVFYGVWILLAAVGLCLAIQLYRKKRIGWPQARRMGIPMTIFVWMNVTYGLVLLEGAYGLVSVILDLPLLVDIALLLVIFGIAMGLYWKLLHREKFNKAVFTALFLIPLCIPGTHTAARLMPTLDTLAPLTIPGVQAAKKLISSDVFEAIKPKKIRRAPQWPQKFEVGDSGYVVEFANPVSKGTFGDALTARRLTAKGYIKLPSKLDGVRGLDGVYVRYDKDNIQEILIVENKVDGGTLRPGQMTDEWIAERVNKMLLRTNAKVREAGNLIRSNPDLVRKELWHHDLSSGRTTINTLDPRTNKASQKRVEKFLSNQVRKRCESLNTKLICLPAA